MKIIERDEVLTLNLDRHFILAAQKNKIILYMSKEVKNKKVKNKNVKTEEK